MSRKITIEQEINDFLDSWDCKALTSFLRDIIPLFELYDVEDEDDWVEKKVGGDEENVRTVRLIRTVYLVSRIAELHGGKLCLINAKFRNLWKRMEKQGHGQSENIENFGLEELGGGTDKSNSCRSISKKD